MEQICRHEKAPGYRRYLKRLATRRRRTLEKRRLEDAPKKNHYRGYSA